MLIFLAVILLAASMNADEIAPPSGPGAAEPFLVTSGSDLLMTWIEPASNGNALKLARFRAGRWSAAQAIFESPDVAANWANFPSAVTSEGAIFVQWVQKNSGGHHAADVYVASSRDDGKSWSKPILLHRDNTPTEHGFASLAAQADGSAGVIWLDGRQMKHDQGDMTLRYAQINADGKVSGETVVDARVCECCGTSLKATSDGLVAVYRDRSSTEDRDIAVVTRRGGKWSKPALVHKDGWTIKGCPVNGPQLATRGNQVAAAWFTAAGDKGRVKVAFSSDGGATFRAPVNVDDGAPVGRVDLVMLEDGSAFVTWIDGTADAASVMVRRVFPDGRLGPITKVASTSGARSAGFPRAAIAGERLYIAWTEPSTPKRIRISSVSF